MVCFLQIKIIKSLLTFKFPTCSHELPSCYLQGPGESYFAKQHLVQIVLVHTPVS